MPKKTTKIPEQSVQSVYPLRYESKAEFIAWLTDQVPIEEDNQIRIISKSEAQKKIREFLKNNNHIEADRLMKNWNTVNSGIDLDDSNVISRSVRINPRVFLALDRYSRKKDLSYNDANREILVNKLKAVVEDMKKEYPDSTEKLETIGSILSKWENKQYGRKRKTGNILELAGIDLGYGSLGRSFGNIESEEFDKAYKDWLSFYLTEHALVNGGDPDIIDEILTYMDHFETPGFTFVLNDDNTIDINLFIFVMSTVDLPLTTYGGKLDSVAQAISSGWIPGFIQLEDSNSNAEEIYEFEQARSPAFSDLEKAKAFLNDCDEDGYLSFDLIMELGNWKINLKDLPKRFLKQADEDYYKYEVFTNLRKVITRNLFEKLPPGSVNQNELKKKLSKLIDEMRIPEARAITARLGAIDATEKFADFITKEIAESLLFESHVVSFTAPTIINKFFEGVGGKRFLENALFEMIGEDRYGNE